MCGFELCRKQEGEKSVQRKDIIVGPGGMTFGSLARVVGVRVYQSSPLALYYNLARDLPLTMISFRFPRALSFCWSLIKWSHCYLLLCLRPKY